MGRRGLNIGETTIATCKVVHHDDGYLSMQWRIKLHNGQVKRQLTKMKTTRETDVRHRAYATAQRLLSGCAGSGRWSKASAIDAYIRAESIPVIERNQFSKPLRENTQTRYIHVLNLFAAQMRGIPIADAVKPRALNNAFAAIAQTHGTASARQAAKVVSKYVMRRLVMDEVIEHNTLSEIDLELPEHKAANKPTGGRALEPEEHEAVVEWLLHADPAMEKGKRGRYSAEARTAKRAEIIDLTLTQAVTGLRIGEACALTPSDVDLENKPMLLTIPASVSKTHRSRTVPVLDDRVAQRIAKRVDQAIQGGFTRVFGSPAAPEHEWDSSNRQKAVRALYDEISDTLDIPLLKEVSSHVWRATLNTIWMQRGIPDVLRAAHFGHSVDMNRSSYTDTSSIEQLLTLIGYEK